MEDLFQMLSSSARIDKSKRKKKKRPPTTTTTSNNTHKLSAVKSSRDDHDIDNDDNDDDNDNVSIESNSNSDDNSEEPGHTKKKKRKQVNSNRPKKQHSTKKLKQIHQEEINAFRRKMGIRLSSDNKHEISIGTMSDPISSFKEWSCPTWWANNSGGGSGGGGDSIKSNNNNNNNNNSTIQLFHKLQTTILQNIEHGHWTEPTPIQMQSLPSLMDRRDIMGCAPTGSGKSGAFILPAIMLAKCSEEIYYNNNNNNHNGKNDDDDDYNDDSEQKGGKKKQKQKNKKHDNSSNSNSSSSTNLQGQIRTILLAPSRELASQIHREISRLSTNLHGKFHVTLLSKSNAGLATSNQLGGKYYGLDCLVTTPLRLVECIERGMKLQGVRLIVLDEADRLLDASDGRSSGGLDGS